MVSFHSIPDNRGEPHQLVPLQSDRNPAWQYVAQTGSTKTHSGVAVTERKILGHAPFWRGIKLLADSVSELPLNVYFNSGGSREIVTGHPAQKLLKRDASSILSSYDFISTMTAQAVLHGNSFAYIERTADLKPASLWILAPDRMSLRYFEDDLWYAFRMADGAEARLPSRNVIHLKGLSGNGVIGWPVLSLLAESMGLSLAAQQFGSQFFGQGCHSSGILMVPGAFSESKVKATLDAWNSMSSSLANSHKVALLQEGTKYQPYSVSPNESQFLQTRIHEIRTIAACLGIPSFLLGDDAKTSYSSLESEHRSFLTHSLSPWLTRWGVELSRKLLTERERDSGHYIESNREASVQMLMAEKLSGIRTQLETSLLSPNEARALLNLHAIEGGDVRFRPANWVPTTAVAEPEPAAVPTTTTPAQASAPPTESPAILSRLVAARCQDKTAYERRKVRSASAREKNFCSWVSDFYADFGDRFLPEDPRVLPVVREHCRETVSQLLEIAGACTTATGLQANVFALTSDWNAGRADRLAGRISVRLNGE